MDDGAPLDDSMAYDDDDDDFDQPVGSYPVASSYGSSGSFTQNTSKLVNYNKMNEIFKVFWELDLEGPVSLIYFGRISEQNYRDFGIDKFEGTLNNLSYIKVSV